MTSKTEKQTFCRVCEPSCGLIATLEEGAITALKPDRDHPVTRGFACHKGLSVLHIHQDPERLNWPLVRQGAALKQTSWQEAAVAVGDKIKALQAAYGDQAIGVYTGNPLAFNSTAGPAIGSFVSAIGSRRNFSSGTQDCSNKFAASEAVFGSSTIHPIPDIAHTDFLLILGANPRVSHMSFVSIADPIAELRAAKQRGARLVFVDPRLNESVSGLGELLQIKPDTDTYLLAAMVHYCFSHGLIDTAVTARYAEGLDFLEAFAADYSAQKVASVVGLTVDAIEKIASEFAAADRAAVYMSTGVNMGRQGALAYWLLYMLSFITGNLGRQGGNKYAQGFYPALYYPHNVHFLWAASTMEGRSKLSIDSALKVSKYVRVEQIKQIPFLEFFHTIPLLSYVRFAKWDKVFSYERPDDDFKFSNSIFNYALSVAHAANGNLLEANRFQSMILNDIESEEVNAMVMAGHPTKSLMKIASLLASGSIDMYSSKYSEAIASFKEAVTIQDTLPYTEPPFWYYPTRQTLGHALLMNKSFEEAALVFERDLKDYPRNGWSYFGLHVAENELNNQEESIEALNKFKEIWGRADISINSSIVY